MNQTRVDTTDADLNGDIPWLENGDRLDRSEFERRYSAMPPHVRAELIEGVVYVSSPVSAGRHGIPHANVMWWLTSYTVGTPGTQTADNATVRLDLDNEPQPDGVLYVRPEFGGQVQISPDDYIEGAPELAAEVSSSRVSIDLGDKKTAYQRNGIKEYVVWRVRDAAIDWFVLRDGDYQPLAADAAGVVRSETFPGLWLDTAALLRADLATVQAVLQQGLASPEHARFVAELQARRRP